MEGEKSSSYSHAAASFLPNQSVTTTTTTTTKLKFIVLGGANAGKTSILRKYFHGKFDPARRPTVGSDFYTQKKTMETTNNSTSLSMQVWDTPGRERFAANPKKPLYTAAFSDSFFKNADAAILVYDITSSTSFTHVLKWYEDLMARIRRLEVSGQRTQAFPVVIVGTKVDIMRERESHPSQQRVGVVPQRKVLGMKSDFRGNDLHYEYTVSAPVDKGISQQQLQDSSSSSALSTTATAQQPQHKNNTQEDHHRHRFELSTYMGTDEKTNYLQAVLNNEVQIGSYLESLLSTEDGSHPDKDMVLLWCMRNGLKHMEVSALDGTGIDEMIQTVIEMSLSARESSSTTATTTSEVVEQPQQQPLLLLERNKELDLHQRYATKDPNCFRCFSLFRRCGKAS